MNRRGAIFDVRAIFGRIEIFNVWGCRGEFKEKNLSQNDVAAEG